MSKAVSTTSCSCASALRQLKTDWNLNTKPDLTDIAKRLRLIREQHLTHSAIDSQEFDSLYSTLQGRLKTDQSSSPGFLRAPEVKKSTGARLISSGTPAPSSPVASGTNPTVPLLHRASLTRHHTEFVPDLSPTSPTSISAQQTPKPSSQKPPQPSSDSDKKSEGNH